MLTHIKVWGTQYRTFTAQEVIKLKINPICWKSFRWNVDGFHCFSLSLSLSMI